MFVSWPTKLPPLLRVPATGAVTGAAAVALLAANAGGVRTIMPARASVDARIGSRSFIRPPEEPEAIVV
jgi:hypothetical protein